MQSESFIAGKDASRESSISTMQGKPRFFGKPSLGLELADCDMYQRLLAGYAKLHPGRATA